MNLRKILQSGEVVRFHNHAGIDKQKNSEHEWGVALIVSHIYPEASKDLILAALTHDASEYLTGDTPFPAKQLNHALGQELKMMEREWEEKHGVNYKLSQDEHLVLKMADTLEGMWYCIQQVRMGHINAKRPFRKWDEFFAKSFTAKMKAYPKANLFYNRLLLDMGDL